MAATGAVYRSAASTAQPSRAEERGQGTGQEGAVMLDKWIEKIRKCELLPELDLKHLCEYVQVVIRLTLTLHPTWP